MRKLIAGLVAGFIIAVPVSAYAGYAANSQAKLVGGVSCTLVVGNDNKTYPSNCSFDVDKIVDGNNICYITTKGSISCVKNN